MRNDLKVPGDYNVGGASWDVEMCAVGHNSADPLTRVATATHTFLKGEGQG